MNTSVPVEDTDRTVSDGMLIDAKAYQQTPVRKILNPENLRPGILLADAVGWGKTIEIGLILAELIKRGRGDRILIVTPNHVLEQMQHEMWTKFAIPFVRLDSQGIQRIRQKLPATRNPFTYFKRAIISNDTLKSDRYLAHLRKHQWDAVVIDESHNVTNTNSLNHRLADTLAKNTEALVLASALEVLTFKQELVDQRKNRKRCLTQGEVAERMGVSQSTVAELERFDSNPTLRTLQRYANAVEVLISFSVQDDCGEHGRGVTSSRAE